MFVYAHNQLVGSLIVNNSSNAEIPLTCAAQRLGISWHRAWRLVLTGTLEGRKVRGRWVVGRNSVARCLFDSAMLGSAGTVADLPEQVH